jgi:predicted RNA-binding protein YlxR (DUF448 family)
VPREPERTCIGCRARSGKRDLVRVARSSEGGAALDLTATAPGRGAYVHRRETCVQVATRPGVLSRALRTDLGERELSKLRSELQAALGAR